MELALSKAPSNSQLGVWNVDIWWISWISPWDWDLRRHTPSVCVCVEPPGWPGMVDVLAHAVRKDGAASDTVW